MERTNITNLVQNFTIENKRKKYIDWVLNASIRPNFTRYKSDQSQNENFLGYGLYSDIVWYINSSCFLDVNIEHETFTAAGYGESIQVNYINSSLNKTFKDGQYMLSLKGANLLNEKNLIQRNNQGNQYTESVRNILGRYFLLSFRYKIRSFGK